MGYNTDFLIEEGFARLFSLFKEEIVVGRDGKSVKVPC